ncbi:MAG: AAA family ATPase [Bradyrhizobium sp.]
MQLVFIYGQVASGKLTIARELSARTGIALFHNHLVVDAVAAVFPFGSEPFSRLREQFWMAVFEEAARQDRSLIFTFAPEPTVAVDFPDRARAVIAKNGGRVIFVALELPRDEQERRLVDEGRAAFGKMRDLSLLRKLRPQFEACTAAMSQPALRLDVSRLTPSQSAEAISRLMSA